MATLTPLEEKLGEVWGLAEAAATVTAKVEGMVQDQALVRTLRQMSDEARETAARCEQVAARINGKKTAVGEKAREAKRKAAEMARTYLEGEDEGLSGFEFLVMAEAGEVGHWKVLRQLNGQAADRQVGELVDFALPIQERHFRQASEGALTLASQTEATQSEG